MGLPNRKLQRLDGYDYSSFDYYHVTICTHDKRGIFGEAGNLNDLGRIAESELLFIPEHFDIVRIVKYAVMPNHVHAIISIGRPYGSELTVSEPT